MDGPPRVICTTPDGAEMAPDGDHGPYPVDVGADALDTYDEPLLSLPTSSQPADSSPTRTALFQAGPQWQNPFNVTDEPWFGNGYLASSGASDPALWVDQSQAPVGNPYPLSAPSNTIHLDIALNTTRSVELDPLIFSDHTTLRNVSMSGSTIFAQPYTSALFGFPQSTLSSPNSLNHDQSRFASPSFPPNPVELNLRLRTDFIHAAVESNTPISSPSNCWSGFGTPTSVPSSGSNSPMVYTPSLQFNRGLRLGDYSVDRANPFSEVYPGLMGYDTNAAVSPSSLSPVSDTGALSAPRGRRPSHADHRTRRKRYNASRSSSASSGARIPQEFSPEIELGPSLSIEHIVHRGVVSRERRASSGGPREFSSGMSNAASDFAHTRTRLLSDSFLTERMRTPPSSDDSGKFIKGELWAFAQQIPTFEDDEPSPTTANPTGTASGFVKKVASEALVNATTRRRKNNAKFFCDLDGSIADG
ncbi:hypothetical protein D9757_005001 [Collybiopsis confluens]|uniref:Uncharacterized protein n=1 Tax=Collybiopsis confluens TaxID=2823264 RepID=A0A8H5HTE1_9AGAR|nr:hypothetical protein D9757_005001 [Collybiopsis confluens]